MNLAELKRALFPPGVEPRWGIVLGSGFDVWLEELFPGERVPFSAVEGLGTPTVEGHEGYLTAGRVGAVPVAVSVGRLHLYEGWAVPDVVAPARTLASLGAPSVLLTTAVGSLVDGLMPGQGVVITDQINLTGRDPHTGTGRFQDASSLYDPDYIRFLKKGNLVEGVLAGLAGPSFETPAEVRALVFLGAHVVCMSTVLEVLALAAMKIRCAAVAVVANAAGVPGTSHAGVLDTVRKGATPLWPSVADLIARCG